MWRIPSLVLVGLFSGTLGYWSTDRGAPTDFISAHVVKGSHAYPGGELQLDVEVYRHHSCAASFDRILTDAAGRRYVLPETEFRAPPVSMGRDAYVALIRIPDTFAVGQAKYRFRAAYYCNPIHRLWPVLGTPLEIRFTVEPPPTQS